MLTDEWSKTAAAEKATYKALSWKLVRRHRIGLLALLHRVQTKV